MGQIQSAPRHKERQGQMAREPDQPQKTNEEARPARMTKRDSGKKTPNPKVIQAAAPDSLKSVSWRGQKKAKEE